METALLLDATAMSIGLLIVRLVLGLGMAAHGAQKLFGWFGGYGLAATGGFLESIGFRPGRFFAATAAIVEVASGLIVALGLFGPVGPALMVAVMIIAAVTVHAHGGFFAASNGFEMPLLYGAGAFALALVGPGSFSLDSLIGLTSLSTATAAWIALAVAVAGALGNLMARRQPDAATA